MKYSTRFLIMWNTTILVVILYIVLLTGNTVVVGHSMEPTLLDNQHISIKPVETYMSIGRDDIIVFKSPSNTEFMDVKRVIAVSGDEVTITKNVHRVNGKITVKPYVDKDTTSVIMSKEFTVPDNSFYVLGDNFYNSVDSRHYGFVPFEYVVGVVKVVK